VAVIQNFNIIKILEVSATWLFDCLVGELWDIEGF